MIQTALFRITDKFVFLFVSLLFITSVVLGNDQKQTDANNKIMVDEEGKRCISAVFVEDDLKIDGILNESAWTSAQFQSHFMQREPEEGKPATEKTEVAVLFDEQNLYIGIKCYDSEPEKIVVREMRRDEIVDNDDFFELILDTYHDHRTGFYFIFNAHGSKRDAALANESRNFNSAWDGIWKCKTQINEKGWFAEIAIPWKTLRFKEKDAVIWGINFARMIRRKNEHVHWQLVTRDIGRSGILRLSEGGSLIGLSNLHMGGNLELKPYFLGGLENDANTEFKYDGLSDLGLDAKVALSANITMDLTVNTDFAQVEADQEQVNLDRFDLYYPEKREFFLEGDEVFTFGERSARHSLPDFSLFYSRRIGLADGHEARILGGTKIVSKVEKYQIGVMNLLTDEVSFQEDSVKTKVNPVNFSVIRIRRDILNRANLGFMFLNKELQNSSDYNRTAGFDLNMPLSQMFSITSYLAATFGPDEEEDSLSIDMSKKNLTGKLNLTYDSDLWDFAALYEDVGARFNPEMGFIKRKDYRFIKTSAGYSPRPENSAFIRQFGYSVSGQYRSDHNDKTLERDLDASFGITFQNSAEVKIGAQVQSEFLDMDWEVRDGLLIPSDNYSGFDYYLEAKTDVSRPYTGEFVLNYGNYFTGNRFRGGFGSVITSIPRVRLEFNYDYNQVDLPVGDYKTNALGLRALYFFSTELYLKAYVQWNDDKLRFNGKEKLISNFLVRWIYSPGSDFYLLYNDGRMIGPGQDEISNRTVMLKFTYLWRR